jgi:hypothetical protein
MLFNSFSFLFIFFPVVLLGFYVFGRINHSLAILWLCGASLYFFGQWNAQYLWLLSASIITNYVFGYTISHSNNGKFVSVTSPGKICQDTKALLRNFIDEMKKRGVQVYFAHSPYGIEGEPQGDWKKAELQFQQEIHHLGCELIDERNKLFFRRKLFYNTALHMTSIGKELRTQLLIEKLRKKI